MTGSYELVGYFLPIPTLHVALLRLLLERISLIMKCLASAHSKLKLDMTMPKIQLKRYYCKPFRLGFHAKLLNFLSMDEQLAISARIMIKTVSELVHRNIHSTNVQFVAQNSSVRTSQSSLTMTHNLDFGTSQLNTALDSVEYGIVVPCLAVYGKIAGRRMLLLCHALFVVAVYGTEC